MPLSKVPDFLGLTIDKEAYDYQLNNVDVFFQRIISYDLITDIELRNQIKSNCVKLGYDYGDEFNIMKYCEYYCMRDIEVTKQAMEKFRSIILEHLDLDILNSLTVSSLAQKYFEKEGVYDEVVEIGGITRMFIQKCVVGGRVMCAENKKMIIEECIDDFDAVSLYPSAMSRMMGLPIG